MIRKFDTQKSYPFHQSPLFKVKSIAQLADILGTDRKTLNYFASTEDNYIRFTTDRGREIQWPKPNLRRIHRRVADLLSRVETPEFLHSAKRGRSYVTNAAQHNAIAHGAKVDIKQFFQSVRYQAVFHFFRDRLQCEPDVAAVVTKLLTVDRHLPTGGNASPILSFFAYYEMFSELSVLAEKNGCTLTCLIDDMTFTGRHATGKLIHEVRSVLKRYRLFAHKTKVFKPRQARVITGVAVTVGGLRLPNKRQRAISFDTHELASAGSDDTRLLILRRLIGRMHEAAQIDPAWRPRAVALVDRRRAIVRRLGYQEC